MRCAWTRPTPFVSSQATLTWSWRFNFSLPGATKWPPSCGRPPRRGLHHSEAQHVGASRLCEQEERERVHATRIRATFYASSSRRRMRACFHRLARRRARCGQRNKDPCGPLDITTITGELSALITRSRGALRGRRGGKSRGRTKLSRLWRRRRSPGRRRAWKRPP